jgi:hypothetical protein
MSLGDHFGLFSDPGEVFGSSPRVPREIVPDFGGTWCDLVSHRSPHMDRCKQKLIQQLRGVHIRIREYRCVASDGQLLNSPLGVSS